jgi:hypothetical protein
MKDDQTDGLRATEAECAAGRTAPRVSLADIEANILWEGTIGGLAASTQTYGREAGECDDTVKDNLNVLTIHLIVLRNGFTIIGKSAPASPENFDADLGRKLAREDAIRQAWPLMGYALREKLALNDSAAIKEYVEGYELRGDQDYQPTDRERFLIEDALRGYLAGG